MSTINQNIPTSILNTLNQNYSNFTFDLQTHDSLSPYLKQTISFFKQKIKQNKIKNITLYDCYFWSNTLLSHPYNLNQQTINLITNYTYYLTQNYPELLK
jgi:hypothetical protein